MQLDPTACKYEIKKTARMRSPKDEPEVLGFEMVYVLMITPTGKKRPALRLIGETIEDCFDQGKNWVALGCPGKQTLVEVT